MTELKPLRAGRLGCLFSLALAWSWPAVAAELQVSTTAVPGGDGSVRHPFSSISAAARVAQPGDTIVVHTGVYRERVTPPRGGTSDSRRIVYEAAPGENVVIKGSEQVRGWQPLGGGVWEVTLPNTFFGTYNPYKELIAGDWFTDEGWPHHAGEVYFNGHSLYEVSQVGELLAPTPAADSREPKASLWTWYCESDATHTRIYANFHNRNPNRELVEISVRESCFYPAKTGCDFITVRGFRMCQAATQWAPPTAEQIGLIGTNWSKGWIIENNIISDSKCAGITLGKDRASGQNVWTKDPTKDGAVHYNEVIQRALQSGWSRATIGSHIVRNNTIHDCEQAGICGSLGAIFSRIVNNHIYNIWVKRQFFGQEIAGIKLHAAVDVLIEGNRIHNAGRGMWMDWMAQGMRITRNLCYDNTRDDLFVEVNHGPFVVDNNLFLSGLSLRDWSEGGAYAYNLFGGQIESRSEPDRATPFLVAHGTQVAGLRVTRGGDERFYNNIFCGGDLVASTPATIDAERPRRIFGYGLWMFDYAALPVEAAGNIYCGGAKPCAAEAEPTVVTGAAEIFQFKDRGVRGTISFSAALNVSGHRAPWVNTELLGRTRTSDLPFESAAAGPLEIAADFFDAPRDGRAPRAGPFAQATIDHGAIRLW